MILQPDDRNNLRNITDVFVTLQDSAAPFFHLLQSTSFIEANKIAIPQLLLEVFKKNWSQMDIRERTFSVGRSISSTISTRFNYLVLLCKSSLDLVIVLIKAVVSTILKIVVHSQEPAKHWRHFGVALFTIINSTFGIITPKYANLSQLFFSVTTLSIKGKNVKDKINNLIIEVQNRWQRVHQQAINQQ